ncbi:MAG: phosphatase PAP2 family protein [Proteobacteria bacterium]|nr:phosphatase PAP2 family protein [Pseudomonadota bacterium]
MATPAWSDPAPPAAGDPPVAGAPAPVPSPAPIATPEPGAAPTKVEAAKDTAKAAALTPILLPPGKATRPAFQLYLEIDLPVLTVGLVFISARAIRTQKAYCAPLCDRSELNALDRTTAGYWSPGWVTSSNLTLAALGVGALGILVADEGPLAALNDAVVIGEAALSATAAVSIMTLAAGRPRPFLYGETAPLSDRNSTDAGNSFLSSHAAVSFAIATSTFIAARRLHPNSRLQYAVLGVGLGASTFVAVSRVLAGKHFITDATGGALVGASLGVLISSLHASPVSIVPVVSETQKGLGIQGSF